MSAKRDSTLRAPVGGFVHTAHGLGRLVALEDGTAHVRFFRAPGQHPYEDRQLDVELVTATSLAAHTRAYVHDGRRWRIGRVEGQHPQDPDRFLIAFPNSQGQVLGVDAFDVRWDEPVGDPFEILEAVGGDSPLVYESRLNLLASWGAQRADALGVEGLLLASVELHSHQLRVVRRVATDSVRRYLLADEVGLGKTVEAGALIWQHLRENPASRVLVLSPEHLREQWASELLDRFRTDEYQEAWLRIRSHESDASWPSEAVDLLVVDEAHHFTRSGALSSDARARLAALAHQAQSVLLLTATPVRSNEAGFLDLLHLIDPVNYRPENVVDFVRRVELRDQLALTYQALVPSLDEFDLSLYADELRGLFPEDALLAGRLDAALAADDANRPNEIRRLREHLSETYRLHHRLLRTRRTADLDSTFSVRGRRRATPFTLEVDDPTALLRRELLDSARAELSAAVDESRCTSDEALTVLAELAGRAASLPDALLGVRADTPAFTMLRSLIEPDVWSRWDALVEDIAGHQLHVAQELGEVLSAVSVARGLPRVVVASAYSETATAVAAEMTRRWGGDRVATHLRTLDDATKSSELARWRADGPCSLLICDAGAEEGLNLQEADLLIHLDLPWDSFRIEQRVGRCDRHGVAGRGPIPSSVVVYGDNPYALGWFEFVADGCAIFSDSVSSLQYVLRDTERAAIAEVMTMGPSALTDAIDRQIEALASERVRIVAHDALDALDDESDDEIDTRLLDSDRSRTLTSAAVTWLEGVGAAVQRRPGGALRIGRRPRPQVPFDLELALAPNFETDLALDRSTAVARQLPLLRAGHPLIDVLAQHMQSTDRGVAFAMFRPAPAQWPPVVVLRTDFRLSLSPAAGLRETAAELGMLDWLTQAATQLAPPTIETILATPSGVEVEHPSLRAPYSKQRGDRNLASRPDLFESLTSALDWSSTCEHALGHATRMIAERGAIAQRREVVGTALATQIRQWADREALRAQAGLATDGQQWAELSRAAGGPSAVTAEVIGCGVVFVGDPRRLERRD